MEQFLIIAAASAIVMGLGLTGWHVWIKWQIAKVWREQAEVERRWRDEQAGYEARRAKRNAAYSDFINNLPHDLSSDGFRKVCDRKWRDLLKEYPIH